MGRPQLTAAIITLLILGAMPCLADKVTVDPNAAGAAKPVAVQTSSDARLAQPVSCESGYKRLHYVIEDLAAKTGVSIRCGSNNQDWQVRDLPVVVSAREIPLGKLLEGSQARPTSS